ncbi:carbonic anhydrase 6-like, partial [Cricetulus griseus]|uniref:carbonic anhydrase 6-like n=1 Tax=Cricetulus griseus TaxID=10029 RepID=UPI00022F70E3
QITLPPTMNVTDPDGIVFSASHMNMHWGGGFSELRGSEHTIDGVRSALEIQIVHFNSKYRTYEEAKSQANGLSVLAILIEVDEFAENTYYTPITSQLINIQYPGQTTTLTNIKIQDLFPRNTGQYYTYNGSLTTPPCTENVKWFLFRDTVKLSKAQVTLVKASLWLSG